MTQQTTKSQLIYLAILAFGINLCFAFQVTNLSSIFKFLGAGTNDLPLLWLIPPLTGLIVQPLVGQMSDDTVSRFGKRRPYIVGWGIFAVLSLSILPLANTLLMAILLMWLVDCSLNGSSEGLRALTGDITGKKEERSQAFAIQAFFSGIGAALGTAMPYLIYKGYNFFHFGSELTAGQIPTNLKLSFLLTGAILLIAIMVASPKIKERPLTRQGLLEKKRKSISLNARVRKIFRDLYMSCKKMSPQFRSICFIHALTWMGIFIFWLYFTVALAQNIYHYPVHSDGTRSLAHSSVLQQANLDSSFYFSIYQYVSVAYTLILFFLARLPNLNLLHAASIIVGGIGMALICFEHDTTALVISFIAIGIMWGSMAVLPYAIAMQVSPKGKLGIYLGIFNMSITAPQIICSLILSPIYTYLFHKQASYLLLLAGLLIIFSGILWIRQEKFKKESLILSNEAKEMISVTPYN